MNIVILGVPGSGKGTQSKLLEKKFNLKQLSTGEMLRSEVRNESKIGLRIQQLMHSGKLVSDEIMIELISNYLEESKIKKGVIFDGFPRTVPQAKALSKLLDKNNVNINFVFELIVDDEAIVERIVGRYSCDQCSLGYHDKYQKPKVPGRCDKCGGSEFVRRVDDSEVTVRLRLKQYHRKTAPIIAYYSDAGLLYRINGMIGINAVTKKFDEIIYLKNAESVG